MLLEQKFHPFMQSCTLTQGDGELPPFDLFLPNPSLSMTSSAHRTLGSFGVAVARRRRVPAGIAMRGGGVVTVTVCVREAPLEADWR